MLLCFFYGQSKKNLNAITPVDEEKTIAEDNSFDNKYILVEDEPEVPAPEPQLEVIEEDADKIAEEKQKAIDENKRKATDHIINLLEKITQIESNPNTFTLEELEKLIMEIDEFITKTKEN